MFSFVDTPEQLQGMITRNKQLAGHSFLVASVFVTGTRLALAEGWRDRLGGHERRLVWIGYFGGVRLGLLLCRLLLHRLVPPRWNQRGQRYRNVLVAVRSLRNRGLNGSRCR